MIYDLLLLITRWSRLFRAILAYLVQSKRLKQLKSTMLRYLIERNELMTNETRGA